MNHDEFTREVAEANRLIDRWYRRQVWRSRLLFLRDLVCFWRRP